MEILREIADLGTLGGSIDLAIGVFDGVHRGHAAVVDSAVSRGCEPVVVTFDPHPIRLLRPAQAPPELTAMRHKARLLAALGARHLLPVKFDAARAQQSAEAFVRELDAAGNLSSISVGVGFRFGHGRAGDIALLRDLGAELGFEAHGVEPVVCDSEGERISSTRIRTALLAGDLALASRMLGRDYSILAPVVRGRELGRTIGFPTANLSALPALLPPFGVYAARAEIGGEPHSGIANLGVRPTVAGADAQPVLELHLFDFEGDLYGQEIDVALLSFQRPEKKFDGIDALRAQIATDVADVRASLQV